MYISILICTQWFFNFLFDCTDLLAWSPFAIPPPILPSYGREELGSDGGIPRAPHPLGMVRELEEAVLVLLVVILLLSMVLEEGLMLLWWQFKWSWWRI